MRRLLLAALAGSVSLAALASTDPVKDVRQIMAGTVTTKSVKNAYLSGARDATPAFQGALGAYKAVRSAEPVPSVKCADGTMVAAPGACPVAAPPPPVTPPPPITLPPPTTGLTGEAAIPDNWQTALGIEATWYGAGGRGGVAPPSADPVGAFRMLCGPGQLNRDDALLYPGQKGASHLHQYFGNMGADANSTSASLRTSGGTTCGAPGTPINRSAYWMPAMLDGAGNAVKPDYLNLYYKRNPASDPYCKRPELGGIGECVDLPNGIRFVFGYNMKTGTDGPLDLKSQMHDAIQFQCWSSEDGKVSNNGLTGYYHSIKEVADAGCPVGARLMIIAAAPSCWTGNATDSADHRSHMNVANGAMYVHQFFRACPTTHPYALPNLEVQVAFTVNVNFVAGKWHLSSDEMVPGAVPGSTWHMDYWEAWSPSVKATWHRTCINAKLSCAGGDLGDGTDIKGGNAPPGGYPRHQLVSLSGL